VIEAKRGDSRRILTKREDCLHNRRKKRGKYLGKTLAKQTTYNFKRRG